MAYRDMQYDRKTAKVARYFDRVKDGNYGVPISLHVALNDSCFNRCIMCDHPSRPVMHQMAPEQWRLALANFSTAGVETVCYAGGDPMAYAHFNQVMQAHSDFSLKFGMTITGYVPNSINFQLLRKAEWVRVSLDAVTPEVYEKVRGKVSVHKVKASIERMVAEGVNVAFGITLHADNIDDLPNVLGYAESLGITDIETHHILPESGSRAMRVPEKWNRKIEPFKRCHAVLYQLYIDAQGDVYPCCITAGDAQAAPQAYALGNLFKHDWQMEIWPAVVEYSKLEYSKLPDICRTCCVQRLSQINSICDQIVGGKSFF